MTNEIQKTVAKTALGKQHVRIFIGPWSFVSVSRRTPGELGKASSVYCKHPQFHEIHDDKITDRKGIMEAICNHMRAIQIANYAYVYVCGEERRIYLLQRLISKDIHTISQDILQKYMGPKPNCVQKFITTFVQALSSRTCHNSAYQYHWQNKNAPSSSLSTKFSISLCTKLPISLCSSTPSSLSSSSSVSL